MKEKAIIKIKELLHNKNNLVVLALCGVLLFVIAVPVDNSGGSKGRLTDSKSETIDTDDREVQEERSFDDLQEYGAYLEEKLSTALSMIEGAGKVQVILSFQSTEEKIALTEQEIARSGTAENDSQGGSRDISSYDSKETTVYHSTNGGDSTPYVIKVIQPKVEGVIVIAQGAGSGKVSKNISDAIQALFGLEAHKITIVKMETP